MATKKKRKKEKKRISKIEFSNEPAGPRLWVEGSSFDAELYSPQEIWVGSGAIKKNTLCHMAKSWEWFIIKKKKDRKSKERSTLLRVPPSISYITACHVCPWNHETMKPWNCVCSSKVLWIFLPRWGHCLLMIFFCFFNKDVRLSFTHFHTLLLHDGLMFSPPDLFVVGSIDVNRKLIITLFKWVTRLQEARNMSYKVLKLYLLDAYI